MARKKPKGQDKLTIEIITRVSCGGWMNERDAVARTKEYITLRVAPGYQKYICKCVEGLYRLWIVGLVEAEEGPKRLGERLEVATNRLIFVGAVRGVVEAGEKHQVGQDEDAAAVVVAFRFDVGVRHQEHGQDDRDDIPAREDQAATKVSTRTSVHT